jgi:Putative zinc-finger
VSGHVVTSLSAYLDGELLAAERHAVEAHLQLCDECTRHLEDLAAVDELARALPLEVPGGYFESLPARVRFRVTPRRRSVPRLPVWSWALAAALLVAVVTPALLQRDSQPAEGDRSAAPARSSPLPTERLDEKARAAGPLPPAAAPPEAERRAGASLDEAQSAPRRAPAVGVAQGTLARSNEAGAPLAKAEAVTAKDKLLAPQEPARTPTAPAASTAFTAPAEAAPEGAAGQHLYEFKAESDVTDAPEAAAEDAKETGSAPKPALAARARDAETGRSEPPAPRMKFRALLAEVPRNAVDARHLRERWRAFVSQHPLARHADEGRVRIVEVGVQAWRLSNDPADLTLVKRDAEEYLRRDDAAQGDRVRAVLSTLGN